MTQSELVAAYDIADDSRRQQVSRLLSGFGPRVQLSVFECLLQPAGRFPDLVTELSALIEPLEDQVRLYRLPGPVEQFRTVLGHRMIEERLDFWIV